MQQHMEPVDTTFTRKDLPFVLPMLIFGTRARVGVQITITFVFFLVMYYFYYAAPRVIDAVGHTGYTMPKDAKIPTWYLVIVSLISFVPMGYTFLYLKHNFLKGEGK